MAQSSRPLLAQARTAHADRLSAARLAHPAGFSLPSSTSSSTSIPNLTRTRLAVVFLTWLQGILDWGDITEIGRWFIKPLSGERPTVQLPGTPLELPYRWFAAIRLRRGRGAWPEVPRIISTFSRPECSTLPPRPT